MDRGRPIARLKKNVLYRLVSGLVFRYNRHDVGQQGAALAYYLLFSLFPLLIFVSSLLGLLHLNVGDALEILTGVLPDSVVELCETYLVYVSETASRAMLWFSLVFSIYFPMRAANCLMRSVRRAYGIKRPGNLVRYYLRVLLFTIVLILVIILSLVLITFGERLLLYLAGRTRFAQALIRLWNYLRFLLLALILFATLGILYALAQDERQSAGAVLPGAVSAMAAWVILSVGFSFYVENYAHYSVIYGTLGAVMILMIWLFLSAQVLIMGAELNGMYLNWQLARSRGKNRRENTGGGEREE